MLFIIVTRDFYYGITATAIAAVTALVIFSEEKIPVVLKVAILVGVMIAIIARLSKSDALVVIGVLATAVFAAWVAGHVVLFAVVAFSAAAVLRTSVSNAATSKKKPAGTNAGDRSAVDGGGPKGGSSPR